MRQIVPNISPIDQYTAVHFGVGLLYGTARPPWWIPLLGALAFEAIERGAKRWYPELFPVPTQDSWTNSVMDVAAVMAGWATMKYSLLALQRRLGRAG